MIFATGSGFPLVTRETETPDFTISNRFPSHTFYADQDKIIQYGPIHRERVVPPLPLLLLICYAIDLSGYVVEEKPEILSKIIQLKTKTHLSTMRSVRVYMPGM